jgi:hypothetical protein
VVQVAHTLKIEPRDVRIRVTGRWSRTGSIIKGDAASSCEGVTTEISFDCDESSERAAQLVRMAEASCFTMASLRNPVECTLTATVNGQPLSIDASS